MPLLIVALVCVQPRVRAINDLLDTLRAGGDGVDCYAATRGDVRLAAACLAAYCRQLPQPLLASPQAEALFRALGTDDYALRVAGRRFYFWVDPLAALARPAGAAAREHADGSASAAATTQARISYHVCDGELAVSHYSLTHSGILSAH